MDFLMRRHNVLNLEGTFMRQDVELVRFKIQRGCLEYFEELHPETNRYGFPAEWRFTDTIGYREINLFYKNHVVQDGAQDIRRYLNTLKLDHYDLDEIIKRNNGADWVTFFWLRFDNYGCQQYSDFKWFRPPLLR